MNPECKICGMMRSTVDGLAPFGPACVKGGKHEFPEVDNKFTIENRKVDNEGFEYALEVFFNDVVEATVRYVKGKSYGQDPEQYYKDQLGHWKENFNTLLKERDVMVGENIVKMIHDNGRDIEIAINDLLNYADYLITNQKK